MIIYTHRVSLYNIQKNISHERGVSNSFTDKRKANNINGLYTSKRVKEGKNW